MCACIISARSHCGENVYHVPNTSHEEHVFRLHLDDEYQRNLYSLKPRTYTQSTCTVQHCPSSQITNSPAARKEDAGKHTTYLTLLSTRGFPSKLLALCEH